jgi:hypothetical protein
VSSFDPIPRPSLRTSVFSTRRQVANGRIKMHSKSRPRYLCVASDYPFGVRTYMGLFRSSLHPRPSAWTQIPALERWRTVSIAYLCLGHHRRYGQRNARQRIWNPLRRTMHPGIAKLKSSGLWTRNRRVVPRRRTFQYSIRLICHS